MLLRLIGAIVLIVLLVGPLMLHFGMLDSTGLFKELIEIEVSAFQELVDLIHGLVTGDAVPERR